MPVKLTPEEMQLAMRRRACSEAWSKPKQTTRERGIAFVQRLVTPKVPIQPVFFPCWYANVAFLL